MSSSRTFQPEIICDVPTSSTAGVVSLGGVCSAILPDGCGAYVLSTKTFYRLDKTNTDTVAGGMVAALNGGRWLPQSSLNGSPNAVAIRNILDKTATLTGIGNFISLNDAASSYQSVYTGDAWSISTSTGILTYNGPDQGLFMMTAMATMWNDTTVIDTIMGVSVSNTLDQSSVVSTTSPVATGNSSFYSLTLSTIIQLAQGTTLDLQFAGVSSALTVTKLTFALAPI